MKVKVIYRNNAFEYYYNVKSVRQDKNQRSFYIVEFYNGKIRKFDPRLKILISNYDY